MNSVFDSSASHSVGHEVQVDVHENTTPVVAENQEAANQDSSECKNGAASDSAVPRADQLVEEIRNQELKDPVEILRLLKKKLIQGRDLRFNSRKN